MKRVLPALFALILSASLILLAQVSQADTAPGDSIHLVIAVPDSSGMIVTPSALRIMVYERGDVIDSTKTIGSGITQISDHKAYGATYVVPDSVYPNTWLNFFVEYTGDYTDNFGPFVSPRAVLISSGTTVDSLTTAAVSDIAASLGDVTVDSLTANAVTDMEAANFSVATTDSITPSAANDMWVAMSENTIAILDSTDTGGLYHLGNNVTGAHVWAVDDSLSKSLSHPVGYTQSNGGDFRLIVVGLNPTQADTVYVWAQYGYSWLKERIQVVIP